MIAELNTESLAAFSAALDGIRRIDGISAPGNYVDVTADMDVLFVISNCPQVNNPCNGFNPTPIQVMIWNSTET